MQGGSRDRGVLLLLLLPPLPPSARAPAAALCSADTGSAALQRYHPAVPPTFITSMPSTCTPGIPKAGPFLYIQGSLSPTAEGAVARGWFMPMAHLHGGGREGGSTMHRRGRPAGKGWMAGFQTGRGEGEGRRAQGRWAVSEAAQPGLRRRGGIGVGVHVVPPKGPLTCCSPPRRCRAACRGWPC